MYAVNSNILCIQFFVKPIFNWAANLIYKLAHSLLDLNIYVIHSYIFTANNGQSHDKEFMPYDALHCITAVNDYSSKQNLQLSHKKAKMLPDTWMFEFLI